MKKAIIILVLLLSGVCARAQYDTLDIGDREPTYYYWGTNWWDYYYEHGGQTCWWQCDGVPAYWRGQQSEVARYCYIDTSLRVIGVAAELHINYRHYDSPGYPGYVVDSILKANLEPEYLRLYEVDSLNDSMILLASAEWNASMTPRYKIVTQFEYNAMGYKQFRNLYEVFFDSAITVHDSFYVALTGNNNYNRYDPKLDSWDKAWIGLSAVNVEHPELHPDWFPKPNHVRSKLHRPYSVGQHPYYTTDTNWHTFKTYYIDQGDDYDKPLDQFIYLFPIIDTSRVIPPPACYTPGGLTKVYAQDGVATLMWNGSPHTDHWQLSLCPDGCDPEEGNITEWVVTVATLNSLDTGRWYTARVRSVCVHSDSAYYSDWSDSLSFYMPGGNGGGTDPTGIETVADRYTYLMPNPASGELTVTFNRAGEYTIEILDLRGVVMTRSTVDGKFSANAIGTATGSSFTLDISSLPAATYLVRISTGHGTAFKKLVVK